MDKKNEACSPAEKVGKAAEQAGQLSFQLFVAARHDLTDESAAVVADMVANLAQGICDLLREVATADKTGEEQRWA